MKIVFTKHSQRKFRFLRELNWKIRSKDIKEAIQNPDSLTSGKDPGTQVVLKRIDLDHDLRVVYTKSGDIITVITFYPVRGGRYEKK